MIVQRVYEEPKKGYRVLVDRLWPRGVTKERAAIDAWEKEITPSNELRTWYHNHRDKYSVFAEKYDQELNQCQDTLASLAKKKDLILVTAVKDIEQSHIPILMKRLSSV